MRKSNLRVILSHMRLTTYSVIAVVVAAFLLFSCSQPGGSGSSNSGSSLVEVSKKWTYDGSNPLYSIDFDSYDQLNLMIEGDFSSENIYIIKANVSDTMVSSGDTGKVTLNASSHLTPKSFFSSRPTFNDTSQRVDTAPQELRRLPFVPLEKYALPPDLHSSSPFLSPKENMSFSEPQTAYEYGSSGKYNVGDTKTFWQATRTGNGYDWEEVTAKLKARGYYTYVWVDEAHFGSGANQVDSNDVEAILNSFDGTDDESSDDGIYEWISHIYGHEHGGGTGDGGIDSDKRVSIFITDLEDDYESSQTAGIFGYYWPKDEHSQADLDTWFPETEFYSNETEMFYIDAHFTHDAREKMKSTLAHEYQHMINYNRKTFDHGESSPTWYNEMLSLLTEDLMQSKLGLSDNVSPKSRTNTFCRYYYKAGVTEWDTSDSIYDHYASDFVFGAYLARNYGGTPLVSSIVKNENVGAASVSSALDAAGYSKDFDQVFREFARSLLFSSATSEFKSMDVGGDVLHTIDGEEYTLSRYDIYDYGYSMDGTDYSGPILFNLSYQQELRPYGLTLHGHSDLFNLNGEQSLELTCTSLEPGVEYYLVVK